MTYIKVTIVMTLGSGLYRILKGLSGSHGRYFSDSLYQMVAVSEAWSNFPAWHFSHLICTVGGCVFLTGSKFEA